MDSRIASLPLALLACAATIGPPMKPIPPPAVEALRRSLREIAEQIPPPESPYAIVAEESKIDVDPNAPWDAGEKSWARPGRASAVTIYDVPEESPGIPAELRGFMGPVEVTVEVNGEARFADLASEGGPPALFPLKDATGVEVSAIAPGAVQGRVAAMTPRQSEYRLTAITIFVGDRAAEAGIRNAVKARPNLRVATKATGDPGEVQLISVRIHGPKKPSEALARRIPATSLRRLLLR
jgi:hypothetical protein